MIRYGFELEGFYIGPKFEVELPPKSYPTDGFPGLVELRTYDGDTAENAYGKICALSVDTPGVDFKRSEYVFPREFRAEIRRRHSEKTAWDIQNLYGKAPRLLGNKTIASFQVNVSNELSSPRTDNDGKFFPARFGLLDVPRIVRAFDDVFKHEIKDSKRQPGEYCIKDNRLEYRSLPNSVFSFDPAEAREFISKIKKCVEGA